MNPLEEGAKQLHAAVFEAASAIRTSSVATMTCAMPRARVHLSQTCWMSGLPAMGCSGFAGSRVEP